MSDSNRARPQDGPGSREPSPAVSAASGFDPSRIMRLTGGKYSPNLRKFLARQSKQRAPLQRVFRAADGVPYIGWIDDDGWFMGGKLWRVLCVGTKAETYAYPELADDLTEVADFWPRYEAIGRCAIDEDHSRWWINGDDRWLENGDARTCQWCGHDQVRKRWKETVEREQWLSCDSAAIAPKGQPNA